MICSASDKSLDQVILEKFNPLIQKKVSRNGTRIFVQSSGLEYYDRGVSSYEAVLTGIDPLSGDSVENYNIRLRLAIDVLHAETEILRFHGSFFLSFYAVMDNGQRLFLRKYPVELTCEDNRPQVSYRFSRAGKFMQVTLDTNCWGYAKGKLWIRYDGQLQQVNVPEESYRRVRFFVQTAGEPDFICHDSNILIKKG